MNETQSVIAIIAALIASAGAVAASMRRFNRKVGESAVRAAEHEDITRWFREDREHESLPTMVRSLIASVDALGTRLRDHLQDEEAKVDTISQRLASGDLRMARIEDQLTTTLDAISKGNPEIRPTS